MAVIKDKMWPEMQISVVDVAGAQYQRDSDGRWYERKKGEVIVGVILSSPEGRRLSESQEAYLEALNLAVMKYAERDQKHKGLWFKSGWMDSLFGLKHKVARIVNNFWADRSEQDDVDDDDIVDAINYAVFMLANMRKGQRW